MITLKDFLESINYSITEGWDYQWSCFGPNAYGLDHSNSPAENSLSVIFDKQNQTVYSAEAHDYENRRSYRLMNPEFVEAYRAEVKSRGSEDCAYDGVSFVDLETEEDFLEKARAIFLGESYDTRISIPIDFTDEEMLTYMLEAHKRDMTFNQFVEEALRVAIEEHKRDPEGLKNKAQAWKEANAGD
jgi:hypothetical protein